MKVTKVVAKLTPFGYKGTITVEARVDNVNTFGQLRSTRYYVSKDTLLDTSKALDLSKLRWGKVIGAKYSRVERALIYLR